MNFNHVECRMLEATQGKVVNSFCILLATGCNRVTNIEICKNHIQYRVLTPPPLPIGAAKVGSLQLKQ